MNVSFTLFCSAGRLVHIDFGFILEISPGGNMRFESAHFKLSHEMTQLIDPSGAMKSETWHLFVRSVVFFGPFALSFRYDFLFSYPKTGWIVFQLVCQGLPRCTSLHGWDYKYSFDDAR